MKEIKLYIIIYMLLGLVQQTAAQTGRKSSQQTVPDSTDVFYQHLDLNEVVVTGLTGDSRMKEMPAPVTVVSKRDLQASAFTNIIDAVAHMPGLSQITTGSGISKPVIRGLGYNRVAVVNDGIRQEGQQWGDEHGIEVDAESVNSVEILKGPASLMYGSDAMAGVLIFHPQPVASLGELRGNVASEYQTNNGLFGYSANLLGNQNGFVWDARWSQKMAHAYKNRRDGYVPGSQFREQAARAMLGLNKSWGYSHLTLGYYHLTPGIVEGERDETTGELEAATTHLKTYGKTLPFQQIYHYKAVLDNSLNIGNGTLKVLLGYQQNQRKEFEESSHEAGLYFRLHTFNYDMRYLFEPGNDWKLAFGWGGMFQRSENKGEEFLIPAYRLADIGLYATASKRLGKWNLTGGMRADHRRLHSEALWDDGELRFEDFTRSFNGVSGSVGAVYNVNGNLNLRANLSRGFRAPNMSELGANGVHEGTIRYEVGNQHLKPEHSWQLDLGMDYTSRYVSTQVALFANRIDNYIYTHRTAEVFDAEHHTYRYAAGDARLMGFEASVDIHPVHSIHFANAFAMVDARQLHQQRETKFLPFTPAPRWTSEVKYELTHDGRFFDNTYFSAELFCHLRQNHYYMADETETATPSYTLFNLSAGTDIKGRLSRGRLASARRIASLYLTVNNLFDRAYQNHLSRLKYTDENPKTGQMGICNMGRNITLKVVLPIGF